MATFSEILCKDNKKYSDLNKDFKSIMKDIKALKELVKTIRTQQNEIIDEYAKNTMLGKCYKIITEAYIKYIHVLNYEMIDDISHLVYEEKIDDKVKKQEIVKTKVQFLELIFLNIEEIDIDEYNSIIVDKKK